MKKIIVGMIVGIIAIIVTFTLFFLIYFLIFQPIEINELNEFDFIQEKSNYPQFTEISTNFNHLFNNNDGSRPFLGGAIIDIDNDTNQEIFIGGGSGQEDVLLKFENNKFSNIIQDTKLSSNKATYGVNSIDFDNDKDIDLIIAREDGLFLYQNDGGIFSKEKLNLQLDEKFAPISMSVGDFNKDGYPDIYVNTFIKPKFFKSATFNDLSNSAEDILLQNDNGKFIDVTSKLMVEVHQNTFVSSFVDLDGDSWQDLVVATNTDQVKIFKNNKGVFEQKESPTGYGFWMGLGIADIDNDGDQDLILSNSGNTIKPLFTKGDLFNDQVLDTKWAILLNNGNFTFEKKTGLPNLGFGWGVVVEDFNLDGKSDILMSQNYIKWLAHKLKKLPGRLLVQKENGDFDAITIVSGLSNPYYGQSPLIVDLNHDGYQDILLLNINGPLRAFLNKGGSNHYLKIIMPDSAKSLGTSLVLKTSVGTTSKQFFNSQGYMTDQSPEIIFGYGEEELESLTINWPSGEIEVIENLNIDSTIIIE